MIPTELKEHRDFSTFAVQLVRDAGELLLDYFGQVGSVPKGSNDLVTVADTAVEDFMLKKVQRHFPDHQVIAEESTGPGTDSIKEFSWVIDPLDGTVNFAMGIPFFGVSLALLNEGDPLLGCVYDPVRKELFQAQRGAGSLVNGQRLVIASDNSSPAPVGGSSGFLDWGALAGPASPLLPIMRHFGKMRILGSQALHLCYVAARRLESRGLLISR